MNISMQCQFTVSKKLEKILTQGEPVWIQLEAVHGNRGTGWIRFSSDVQPKPSDIGQTSIMLEPVKVKEESIDYQESPPVQTFFGKNAKGGQPVQAMAGTAIRTDPDAELSTHRTPWASKMAGKPAIKRAGVAPKPSVEPPPDPYVEPQEPEEPVEPQEPAEAPEEPQEPQEGDEPQEVAGEAQNGSQELQEPPEEPQEEIPRPSPRQAPRQAPRPAQKPQAGIMDYGALMGVVDAMGDLPEEQEENRPGGPVSRSEAVKMEKAGMMAPKIPVSAYVYNPRAGSIEVADLGESIAGNEALDLSRLPASRLKNSRDLRMCLERGYLKFVTRKEYIAILERKSGEETDDGRGLKAYSGANAADKAADEVFRDKESAASPIRTASSRPRVVKSEEGVLDTEFEEEPIDPEEARMQALASTFRNDEPARAPARVPGSRRIPTLRSGGGAVKKML